MNEEPTIAFLYRWIQLSSGKWYIGSRTAKGCNPDDGYICSSNIVKPMILENRNDWLREVLEIGNFIYIRELEATYLWACDAKNDPMSFNMHNGDGKFSTTGKKLGPSKMKGMKGKKRGPASPEHIAKRSIALKGKNKGKKLGPQSLEHRNNISLSKKGKKQSPEHIAKTTAAKIEKKRKFFHRHKRK